MHLPPYFHNQQLLSLSHIYYIMILHRTLMYDAIVLSIFIELE
nr:MAG TPA: hypothetical protein [Caudoviricetes sp.]